MSVVPTGLSRGGLCILFSPARQAAPAQRIAHVSTGLPRADSLGVRVGEHVLMDTKYRGVPVPAPAQGRPIGDSKTGCLHLKCGSSLTPAKPSPGLPWPTFTVGKIIDTLLRADHVILDGSVLPHSTTPAPAVVPTHGPRLRAPLVGRRHTLALRTLGPIPTRARHRRKHSRPPAPLLANDHTSSEPYRLRHADHREGAVTN